MGRFNAVTHRNLMRESVYALERAAKSEGGSNARVAARILNHPISNQQWRAVHAELLLPPAKTRLRRRQIIELRKVVVELIHRAAPVMYLRQNEVTGRARRQLFRLLHATHDYEYAVVEEHRRFTLAVGSRIAANHLIDIMGATRSLDLLQMYETVYARYFEIRCEVTCEQDSDCAAILQASEDELHEQLKRIHRRIVAGSPRSRGRNFDYQYAIARSGRYPVLNYMVG